MTHIVHLETGRHLYGGARQVLMLTAGLRDYGIQSTLVCPADSELVSAVPPGVAVQTLPMTGDLDAGFAYRFAKLLRELQPDLVHVHSRRGADLWGGMGAKWAKVPAVLSRRVDNPEPALLAPMKYGRYDRVIGISNGIVGVLREQGVDETKLRLVRSAVDADGCQPTWSRAQFRDAFDLEDQHLAVLCVAQFIPRKGHRLLLDAWPEVSSACRNARLLLFGRGAEQQSLEAAVRDSVSGATVQFAGFRDDLREFLGCADLLVHPAEHEGLGIALLEAQAAGLPVVAMRAGGMPEAVADGESGALVRPGDPSELAHRVIRLLRDAELRQQFGAAGRRHVAEHFSPAAMVAGNVGVYREIIAEKAA